MNVLSWDNISKLTGQTVQLIDGAENEYDVLVESVREESGNGTEIDGRLVEHFTMVLVGPADTEFPQGNYLISHPSMGQQILYMLVAGDNRYTIVINTEA
ncbi:hypothetical protein A1OQ_07750 [Enterovibrio norvegicus FF-162]|uniref:DUF6916 domain-containing protein n=1 Tax=Enterovibrio norvegicus FF-454 TaxID=1185651 RepID=A0A1E5CBL8_9GAMM|nr:hypothetical protein [Enterovibrio norvegicus]OEE62923.1 hypothetical protein A1OK_20280 [Enterovibrio norvegicus FF-454]OEE75019.1 hypothetical protein A1OQ_07750 [Enterovibrio norvegicus FF-162]